MIELNSSTRKKGNRISDIFTLITDKEIKQYFDAIYPRIKDIIYIKNKKT